MYRVSRQISDCSSIKNTMFKNTYDNTLKINFTAFVNARLQTQESDICKRCPYDLFQRVYIFEGLDLMVTCAMV